VRALILAAGRGERMRPLTDTMPKPLLRLADKPLIVYHLERLAAAGVRYVVINTAHLGEQFPEALGDGARWGLRLRYSYEGDVPLETGGGMLHALPLLGSDEPFIAVSADLYTDFDFARLPREPAGHAHLLMVDNPPYHAQGDFALRDGLLHEDGTPRLTFGNIGVYRPTLFACWREVLGDAPGAAERPPRFKLAPLLLAAMHGGAISGEHYTGCWHNLGTPQELAALDAQLRI
jgi:MurNAc alpha-1-phosphate uridylyltransferase